MCDMTAPGLCNAHDTNTCLYGMQAAWFVILVFPDHCDCLALLNAVQRQHNHDS